MISRVRSDISDGAARDGFFGVRPVGINSRVGFLVSRLSATAFAASLLAGCSTSKPEALPDPNTLPANYRADIVAFLRQSLADRAMFRGATIAPPALKPIGDAQRYMVCVRLNSHGQILNKVAVYFGGRVQQFVDATPDECGDAAYQPFPELAAATPAM